MKPFGGYPEAKWQLSNEVDIFYLLVDNINQQ
jgi:hypothetical protein